MNLQKQSMANLLAAANSGDIDAKAELGRRLMFGDDNTKQDTWMAKQYLEEASNAGHIDATRRLGMLYSGEYGIPANYKRSHALLSLAADKGDGLSMFQLANIYMQGQGVEEDPVKAMELIKKSADNGCIQGQYVHANALATGQFYDKDTTTASRYFEMIIERETDEDLDDGELYTIALAFDSLGDMHRYGDPYHTDINRAVALYTKAADLGYVSAQLTLGLLYQGLEGVTRDHEASLYWLKKASGNGNKLAETTLSLLKTLENGSSPEDVAAVQKKLERILGDSNSSDDDIDEIYDTPKNKWITALSYLSILFLIPLFTDKESKFNKFHVKQGATLFIVDVIKTIIFEFILGTIFPFYYISNILGIGIFVLAIIGIYNVLNGKTNRLPILGKITIIDSLFDALSK